ncbi:predicted protein [Nematostella vectensis]|uniref:STAGA complex 65 subunit gamma n=1 Tax=Nematostella vectensis TaxID=45351 RepID=A7RZI4_NEMVE|nr:predicted protein [Nematostella vectensis]|eukprot:XP_001635162.1 predicted protein [Nematostella vectensis]
MAAEMSCVLHWGEIDEPSVKALTTPIESSRPKAVDCEIPRLHQPSSDVYPPKDELPAKFLPSVKPPLDKHSQNLVLHTIELQHHKRRMRQVLMAAQHQYGEKSEFHEPLLLPPHPPKPKRFCTTQGIVTPQTQTTLMARLHTSPSTRSSHKLVYPHLDSVSVRQLLLRAVAAICAHSGFEMASEIALENLTDILHDFSTRFCKLLRSNVDSYAANGRTGFPDVMESALHEIGLGGTAALQKYWISSVQDYALRLQQEDRQLTHDYLLITGEQSSDFSTMSPCGILGDGNGAGELNGDSSSPHWNINFKTEPVDDSYAEPIAVVPATPHSS